MIIPFGIRYSDFYHNMNLETQANNEKEFFSPHHFLTVLKKFHTFKNKKRLPERPNFSPFKNDIFEVQAYSWDDEVHQPYNFKCDDIEISWYKYLGRDTTINGEYEPQKIIDMFNKCLQSILDMDVKY